MGRSGSPRRLNPEVGWSIAPDGSRSARVGRYMLGVGGRSRATNSIQWSVWMDHSSTNHPEARRVAHGEVYPSGLREYQSFERQAMLEAEQVLVLRGAL